MSIEEQLRNDSEAWRRVGSFHLSDVLLAGANRIKELEERIRRLEDAGDVSDQALSMVRANVEHEIRAREIVGRSSSQWPDVLTGCHSGGGIIPAIESWRKAKEAKP